jgi:1,4-alpha-glucan branching enzyme
MGCEFAQWREWSHEGELDWWLAQHAEHAGVQRFVADANRLYARAPALHQIDFAMPGFEWIVDDDREASVIVFLRRARSGAAILVACNFTPMPREHYRVGVPESGYWREVLNSDATIYGGSGIGNLGGVHAEPVAFHGRAQSLSLTLPPLSAIYFEHGGS